MKPPLISPSHPLSIPIIITPSSLNLSNSPNSSRLFFKNHFFSPISTSKTRYFLTIRSNDASIDAQINPDSSTEDQSTENQSEFVQITNPNLPPFVSSWRSKFSFSDQAFFLFTFVAFTMSAAFVSFVVAAVPMLYAMRRTANAFVKLADATREELPRTMAAVKLSGMEVSDLTLELSELSHEISAGVNKSAQAVQAAKVGIQGVGDRAREQTMSMIEENANLPTLSFQTAICGAAKLTSRAVGRATRTLMNLIAGAESNSDDIG